MCAVRGLGSELPRELGEARVFSVPALAVSAPARRQAWSMNRRTVTDKEFMTLVRGVLGLLPLNTNRRARRARRRALDSERENRHDITGPGENARARVVAAR